MKPSDDMVDPGQAGKPDLDVWRAEAGAALAIADGATPGPWETDGGDVVETVNPIDDVDEDCSDVCEVLHYRASDDADEHGTAAFIAAARTGWPRDAARVAALLDMLAASDARVAAWRAYANAVEVCRVSDGCCEDADRVRYAERMAETWAAVQKVEETARARK